VWLPAASVYSIPDAHVDVCESIVHSYVKSEPALLENMTGTVAPVVEPSVGSEIVTSGTISTSASGGASATAASVVGPEPGL